MSRNLILGAATAALLSLSAASAFAQDPAKPGDPHAMNHGSMSGDMAAPKGGMAAPKGDQGLSSQAFAKANARMHEGMAITYTGKADVDFAKGMIAHHQGAIDMAKVELEFGTDPELRALAQEVIAAQEAEIARMKAWLAKNGG
ncbi:CopM family metallochaperone [Rhizobium sp. Leaf341]|uniref:CopM family metallochaperone n=1 Tax=Rhizobium sp. Leaf341 TaxID=1736344 RepID=UPI000713E91E|nr:hypothetical protein ASG03_13965 [Rhizobium sp. Leaf341]